MHGLFELLLVEELEDKEDELAAERRHGDGGGGVNPPSARSAALELGRQPRVRRARSWWLGRPGGRES